MPNSPTIPQLLLSAREASRALGISERSLWASTQPRGPIPVVRLGSRVLYSVESLRRIIAEAERAGEARGEQAHE